MNPHKWQPPGPMAVGTEGHEQTKGSTVILADDEDDGKTIANMRARAAMVGACLFPLSGGGFLLGRWGWSRELPDLRAVAQALRLIDGRRA